MKNINRPESGKGKSFSNPKQQLSNSPNPVTEKKTSSVNFRHPSYDTHAQTVHKKPIWKYRKCSSRIINKMNSCVLKSYSSWRWLEEVITCNHNVDLTDWPSKSAFPLFWTLQPASKSRSFLQHNFQITITQIPAKKGIQSKSIMKLLEKYYN